MTPDKQAAPSEWVEEARRSIASYASAYSVHRDLRARDCHPEFLASVKATLEKSEQGMIAHLESREALVKQLAEALERVCAHSARRPSFQIDADWDIARAALASYQEKK